MKILNGVVVGLVILATVLVAPSGAFAQSFQNGDFETGTLAGWTAVPVGLVPNPPAQGIYAHNGDAISPYPPGSPPITNRYFAVLYPGVADTFTTLSQSFNV